MFKRCVNELSKCNDCLAVICVIFRKTSYNLNLLHACILHIESWGFLPFAPPMLGVIFDSKSMKPTADQLKMGISFATLFLVSRLLMSVF